MPFKLKVGKKTGSYELSRDVFVLAVQLLDGDQAQFTLSLETLGRECLDYVSQRLNIGQVNEKFLKFSIIQNSIFHPNLASSDDFGPN